VPVDSVLPRTQVLGYGLSAFVAALVSAWEEAVGFGGKDFLGRWA